MRIFKISASVMASCFLMVSTSAPSLAQNIDDLIQKMEKMERQIQNLKRQIEDAKAKDNKTRTISKPHKHDHGHGGGHEDREEHSKGHGHGGGHGHGHGHGKTDWSRMTIGGFGELHYNGSPKNEVDFHRFVLAFGYRFNDWISLSTELSLEHALVGSHADEGGEEHAGEGNEEEHGGELELEQASINFDLTDAWDLKAGVIRVPVGLLNQIHEPGTFYGVERNSVETAIIPTGWWEAGVITSYHFRNGLGADAMFSSGLAVTDDDAFSIRSGRKKVSRAPAKDGSFTGRLRWNGYPGVYMSAVVNYQANILQETKTQKAPAWLTNVNMDLYKGPFALRALWARWDISNSAAKANGKDEQWGFYIEPSYRHPLGGRWGDVGVFYRYTLLDQTAGDKDGSEEMHQQIGLNYWPIRNVVFKADYDWQTHGSNQDNIFNLGLGYQF